MKYSVFKFFFIISLFSMASPPYSSAGMVRSSSQIYLPFKCANGAGPDNTTHESFKILAQR